MERELASEPSDATRQAYESLLRMDASSPPKSTSLTPRGAGAPLIGRKQEWGQLQTVWRRAASGHPHMVVLSGEAGIGKTRLAEELVAWAGRQGMTTASAHCYAAEGRLAYAPVAAWFRADAIQTSLSALDNVWLTEVTRLLPELLTKRPDLLRPDSVTEGWQRQHLFEALARALLGTPNEVKASYNTHSQQLLLLLDDMHWCDNETLEWLHYLLRFEPRARLLLIGTVRSEETLPGHPLVSFLGTLQRDSLVTEIALGPLSAAETASLAEHVAGKQLDPAMINTLHHETEGNPLFVVEMVRAGTLEQRGKEQQVTERPLPLLTQPASTLPSRVQAVLSTRLAQLSPFAREVANVAAVIGREFAFAVLARASGESEDTVVRGLDELWQRRMVREQGTGTAEAYDFSHDKLREQAYASLSPAHRRLLHRRVAEAFEVVYAGELDAVSGQIAGHYERAGLPGQAIPYYQRAGEVAGRIYANAEAITAFQQAIILLAASQQGRVPQEKQRQKATILYEDLGDVFERIGRLQEAKQAYQCAMANIPEQEYIWRARLQRKNASAWQEGPANPEGTSHVNALQGYKEAERLLEQASITSPRGWQQEWTQLQLAQLFPMRASADEMTAIIEKAQSIVEQHGTAEQRGKFLLAVAARDVARDRYVVSEKMVSYCRNVLAVVQPIGDRNLIGFAQFALGDCLLWSGHLDEAEEQLCAAMRMAEQIGDALLLARCLTFLPFIFRQHGQVEEVRQMIAGAQQEPLPLKRNWCGYR